jgi:hypothetical protein
MSELTRREAIKLTAAAGAAGVATLVLPSTVGARRREGFLEGTFYVVCRKCMQVDKVEAITRNHTCENANCKNKTVDGGDAYLVCPDGHWRDNKVENVTRQHQCQHKMTDGGICGKQCRGPFPKPKPEPKE